MFESENGNVDIQKLDINNKGEYVITAGQTNNGILGKTDVEAKIFPKKTITVDMFGYSMYRNYEYKMVTHARVFSLKPKFQITDNQGLYLNSTFHFIEQKFGFDNMCSWNKIKNEKIKLPLDTNGDINFSFMEKFIAELEATHIAELDAYLEVTGLKDYELTTDEKKLFDKFIKILYTAPASQPASQPRQALTLCA